MTGKVSAENLGCITLADYDASVPEGRPALAGVEEHAVVNQKKTPTLVHDSDSLD